MKVLYWILMRLGGTYQNGKNMVQYVSIWGGAAKFARFNGNFIKYIYIFENCIKARGHSYLPTTRHRVGCCMTTVVNNVKQTMLLEHLHGGTPSAKWMATPNALNILMTH
jgi:hypothetical protein